MSRRKATVKCPSATNTKWWAVKFVNWHENRVTLLSVHSTRDAAVAKKNDLQALVRREDEYRFIYKAVPVLVNERTKEPTQ